MNHMIVLRAMQKDENEKPLCGQSGRTLGVRPNYDIKVEDGFVYPNKNEGMSVSPPPPSNLPEHRRPKEFDGSGNDCVWAISVDVFESFNLKYSPDNKNPNRHGLVEPLIKMTIVDFQRALESTKTYWDLFKK